MTDAGARSSRFAGARVLMVSSSYPFHRGDYHALFVHDLAKALVRHGARVLVLTPQTPEGGPARERWEGVEVSRFPYRGLHRLPLTGGEGMVENARASPLKVLTAPSLMAAFVTATRRAAKSFRPDVVITHWLVPTGLAVALARLRRPTLHVAHSSDVHLLARLPLGRALSRVIAGSGAVLSTSSALAARLSSAQLVRNPTPWHLPLDLPETPSPRGHAERPLRVVAMSRLIEGKGVLTLVRAAAAVPTVQLRIAGAGPLAPRLKEEIERLQLSSRASLVGAVLGEEKSKLLKSADVFAFVPEPRPGAFEDNLPMSVLEAMAHGAPVLATSVGNLPALLARGGGGVLVEGDVASVAAALDRLAKTDRTHLSRRARETAELYGTDRSLLLLEEALASEAARSRLRKGALPSSGRGRREP